jgi:hypothetical protein
MSETSKPTLVQAAKGWLRLTIGHPEVTDGEARVGSALFDHFNTDRFKQVGELVAWPKQETLVALSTKSKSTVKYAIKKFERLGLLEVARGYNPAEKRRAVNMYRVPPRAMQLALAPRAKTLGPARWPIRDEPIRGDSKSIWGSVGFSNGPLARKWRKEGDSRGQPASESQASASLPSEGGSLKLSLPKMNGVARGPWDPRETAEDRARLENYRKAATTNGAAAEGTAAGDRGTRVSIREIRVPAIAASITDDLEDIAPEWRPWASLLELDGNDLRREPFETRKATLASLLRARINRGVELPRFGDIRVSAFIAPSLFCQPPVVECPGTVGVYPDHLVIVGDGPIEFVVILIGTTSIVERHLIVGI